MNKKLISKWEELKKYLLAVHKEYSDRNGLDYCKNCGVSMEEIVEEFEEILTSQTQPIQKEETKILHEQPLHIWTDKRENIGGEFNKPIQKQEEVKVDIKRIECEGVGDNNGFFEMTISKNPTPSDTFIDRIAMNIVYQLDDDAKLSVEFRQANNDKRIDFVKGILKSSLQEQREMIEREIDDKEIEIYNILEPYFVVLDGRDNESANDTIIEIVDKIKKLFN